MSALFFISPSGKSCREARVERFGLLLGGGLGLLSPSTCNHWLYNDKQNSPIEYCLFSANTYSDWECSAAAVCSLRHGRSISAARDRGGAM
jgi:hypothetical protein